MKKEKTDEEKLKTKEENKHEECQSLLMKEIYKLWSEWVQNTTCHGFPNIFRNKHLVLKSFWLICFLTSLGGCLYIISSYAITFLQFGVNVNPFHVIESPINFPAITICNLNPFFKERSFSFISQVLNDKNLTTEIEKHNGTAINVTKTILNLLLIESSTNPLYFPNRKTFGFNINDILISCTYSGLQCSANDFKFFQSYQYGNCYTFNSGYNSSIRTISSVGPGNSLEIELFSGDPNEELYIYKRGFYVAIHNQSYATILDNEGVFVSTGSETNIGIERKFYYKEAYPYSNCIVDPTSIKSSKSDLYSLIKNSVVKISIFYNDISYDALVESPVLTFDVLLGNVGGSLGLFIGISFLSLVEIFELIFEILRLIHKEGKEKKIKTI